MKNKMSKVISLFISVLMILASLPSVSVMASTDWNAIIPAKSENTFRLGVVADSHIGVDDTTYKNLDKALDTFEGVGADALAMAGDIVYAPATSALPETAVKYVYNGAEVPIPAKLYENLKDVLEEHGTFTLEGLQSGDVFTPDTSKGKPIAYIMGNHEYPANERDENISQAAKQLFKDETGRNAKHVMKAGGYTFIMVEAKDYFNDFTGSEEFVKEQILAAEKADTSNKPIFVLQHYAVQNTVKQSPSKAEYNSDSFRKFLDEHPRVIMLSGHVHSITNDPTTTWQDTFTAMTIGHLCGGASDDSEGFMEVTKFNSQSQCMMIDLTEKDGSTEVTVYRLNLVTGKLNGVPYTYTVDGTKNETMRLNKLGKTNPSIAKAKEGTNLQVNTVARTGFEFTCNMDDFTIVPGEECLNDAYVQYYRIVVKNEDANAIAQDYKIASDAYLPETERRKSFTSTLRKDLDRNTNYTVSIYAMTPFTSNLPVSELDEMGITPISYSFKTSDEITTMDKSKIFTHENVNVALNKPVYSGNTNRESDASYNSAKLVNGVFTDIVPPMDTYSKEDVTLPSGAKTAGATSNADDWFMIDLGRRFNISEVKIWPRQTGNVNIYMQNFDIEVANKEDFSDKVVLGGFKTEGVTSDYVPLCVNGNGNTYRYVRLKKTAGTYHIFSEIEVFADVNVFELSRKRNVEANYWTPDTYEPSCAVDGYVKSGFGASITTWLVAGVGEYDDPGCPYNLVVDLEKDYSVDFIEMFGRDKSDADVYRRNWKIYGFTDAQGNPGAERDDYSDGTLLFEVGAVPYDAQGLKAFLSNNDEYRYIVFSKVVREPLAIGELRIEQIVPSIGNVIREDDKTINISFTEKMDIESLKASNAIALKTKSGDVIVPDNITLTDINAWDGGYDATLTFADNLPSSGLTLKVNGTVKALNGSAFIKNAEVSISGKTVAIDKNLSDVKENVNVAFGKKVYTGNPSNKDNTYKLVNGNYTDIITPVAFVAENTKVELPSGNETDAATSNANDWFMIDLGRRYEISEIKIHPRSTSQVSVYMWAFDVEGANKEDFSDSVTLKKVYNNDESVDGFEPVTVNVDSGAYRYIRIKKTAATYHIYSEIEVFADIPVTEVTKNAKVEATQTDNAIAVLPPENILDGNLYTGWRLADLSHTSPVNMIMDLGAEYPVEMAEMYQLSPYTAPDFTKFNLYGYSAGEAPALDAAHAENGDTLLTTKGLNTESEAFAFEGGNYQYLVLSKPAKTALAISEFKGYVVNPKVYSAVVDKNSTTLTVSFTDKLEASSVDASDFKIDGVELSNPIIASGWDGGYDVKFNYTGEILNGAKLTVNDDIRSENGIEMAKEQGLTVEANVFTVTQDGRKTYYFTAGKSYDIKANFLPEFDTTAKMIVAVKDKNGRLLRTIISDEVSVKKGEYAQIVIEGFVPQTVQEKLSMFIWEKDSLRPLVLNDNFN